MNALLMVHLVHFCLATADMDAPTTVYHDRIDGLLLTENEIDWI